MPDRGELAVTKRTNSRCIAVGSCQLPTGIVDRDFGMKNWHDLAQREREQQIDALLLLGDQIYSDPSSGTWDTKFLYEAFPDPYRRLHEHIQIARCSPPVASMPDDHEFVDGWEPANKRCTEADYNERQMRLKHGLREYLAARLHNYSSQQISQIERGFLVNTEGETRDFVDYDKNPDRHLHFHGTVAATPYFMCNTRLERDPRHAANYQKALLFGEQQFQDLTQWLLKHATKTKIVASPAALMPRYKPAIRQQDPFDEAAPTNDSEIDEARRGRHGYQNYPFSPGVLRSDSWDGFPATLLELFRFIVDNNIQNTIFLSGDLHFASAGQILLSAGSQQSVLTSLHCSALYAPYAFANATPAEFCLLDDFHFSDVHIPGLDEYRGTRYRVQAKTTSAAPGDGFCYLRQVNPEKFELEFARQQADEKYPNRFEFNPGEYLSLRGI